MASRILKQGQGGVFQEYRWRPAGQAEPLVSAPSHALQQTAGAAERLAELERQMEARLRDAYREGEAAGRERWRADYESALERLSASVRELAALKPRLRREAERDLVQLSLAIARRILRRELTVDPAAVAGVVRAALDRLAGVEVYRLRLNPADVAPVAEQVRQGVEVVPDSGLPRGSAVFETARGKLDASVETQLEEIERGFADRDA
jgi:flagellar assembly protein FliH